MTSWSGHGPLAISPDSKRALSAHGTKLIVRAITTGTPVRELDTKRGMSRGALLPDGQRVLVDYQLWDLRTGKMLREWPGQFNTLHDLVFAADPRRAWVVADIGHVIGLFDMEQAEFVKLLSSSDIGCMHIHLAPGERHLFAYDRSGAVSLFDLKTDKEQFLFKATQTQAVAFVGDGERIILAGEDGHIRVFETRTGKALQEVGRHPNGVTSIAVSRDGRLAVTGGTDHTVRVWKLTD